MRNALVFALSFALMGCLGGVDTPAMGDAAGGAGGPEQAPDGAGTDRAGAAPVSLCNPDTMPVIPQITPDVKAKISALFAAGQQQGRAYQVFMKYGDSLTDNLSFLVPFTTYYNNLASVHPELNPLAALTATVHVDSATNSFSTWSLGARRGWTSRDMLEANFGDTTKYLRPLSNDRAGWSQPYGGSGWENPWAVVCGTTNPVVCEANRIHGAFALVGIGTNDIVLMMQDPSYTLDVYKANLRQILGTLESMGVVPFVSTIPDMRDAAKDAYVRPLNQAIIDVARSLGVPVWNYYRQMKAVAGGGLSGDEVHPSCVDRVVVAGPETACLDDDPSISAAGYVDDASVAAYGFNARNLGFMQAYQHVRDEVAPYVPADPYSCN